MKQKILAFVMTVMMSLGLCSSALAAENDGVVGFVNMQAIVANYPGIKDIAQEIANKRNELQKSFNAQAKELDAKAQQDLQQKLNKELADFEAKKMAPVQKQIRTTIDKVAAEKGIKSVVNIQAMVSGGKDLTNDVVTALKNK
ncbi:MAG: OmpH family outer membrane protein [Phascolarctobacterium sp.]|nr:OmpH family outer membrane protein [Phascolarctobacterium sp.]